MDVDMVSIRAFDGSNGSADVFALMCLDAESEAEEHHVFYGPHWWKEFVRRPGGHAFVAVSEEQGAAVIVGFIAVELRGEGAYIAWLHVLQAWRRRGVGRQLLEFLVPWLRERGCQGRLVSSVRGLLCAWVLLCF
eukprot:TRINITY_DN38846_c0_g1_i1.p1 TRINITY_DN38846_c0_g1~~TRINITY_DN38846_c0_g1_i1.p1  ORF type:complete len:135 (+),score=23.72 TRINITY_DN38846_c0_g1_i1:3-407(+)